MPPLCNAEDLITSLRDAGFKVSDERPSSLASPKSAISLNSVQWWTLEVFGATAELKGTTDGWEIFIFGTRARNDRTIPGPPVSATVAEVTEFAREWFVPPRWRSAMSRLFGS